MTRVDAEIREELGDQFATHRRAAVGVNRQLVRADPLFATRRFDQPLRQTGVLVCRDHPAHDVAAEQIEESRRRVIEVRIGPFSFVMSHDQI